MDGWRTSTGKARPKYKQEPKRIDAELRKVNDALDRYFRAFEHGTMPEQACAPRIAALTQQLAGLDAGRAELAEPDDEPEQLSDDDLAALTTHVRDIVANGDPTQQKAVLQAIVAEIKVASRAEIYPYFSLPGFDHPARQCS